MNYNNELKKLRIEKNADEVKKYCKLIEKMSTMSYEIFFVLPEIISIFEGETYHMERINYYKGKKSTSEVWETYMIISRDAYKNIKNPYQVSERYFNHLIKNNLAIKITEGWSLISYPISFSFYKHDGVGRINPQISFKGFPYAKDFIDFVINYKIENSVDELSYDELEKLKEDFILLNVENIYDNYQLIQEKRIEKITKNINSEYEHNKKLLKRFVKKIEDNR